MAGESEADFYEADNGGCNLNPRCRRRGERSYKLRLKPRGVSGLKMSVKLEDATRTGRFASVKDFSVGYLGPRSHSRATFGNRFTWDYRKENDTDQTDFCATKRSNVA